MVCKGKDHEENIFEKYKIIKDMFVFKSRMYQKGTIPLKLEGGFFGKWMHTFTQWALSIWKVVNIKIRSFKEALGDFTDERSSPRENHTLELPISTLCDGNQKMGQPPSPYKGVLIQSEASELD